MLTADLVRGRVQKGVLTVRRLDEKTKARMAPIVSTWLGILAEGIGLTQDEIEDTLRDVEVSTRDRRLGDGLKKLLLDRCTFAMDAGIDPPSLREAVFTRAAAARREATEDTPFDRDAILAEVGAERDLTAARVEAGLFADLQQNQRLQSFEAIAADALLESYDLEQAKAVLLKATRLTVDVDFDSPGAARTFFRKLKFRRLLFRIARRPDKRYHLVIDGPFGLFQSSTRYGLQLALILPALHASAAFALEAEVRWHKGGDTVRYQLAGGGAQSGSSAKSRLPDDVQKLVTRFRKLETPWTVRPARKVLDLPGVGLCIPDLVFTHAESGAKVYLEVMGYWSRKAVWDRVELVEKGLSTPILFALSSRLRVSEKALPDDLPGQLYVYKGVMMAKAVVKHLDALAPHAQSDDARSDDGSSTGR